MQKEEYVRIAGEYFQQGYNCCQAVAAAFSDAAGLPRDVMLRLSCPFGGGFARMRAFEARFGSIICADLLKGMASHSDPPTPEARTEEYYKRRSCLDCVQTAAEILAEDLQKNERL